MILIDDLERHLFGRLVGATEQTTWRNVVSLACELRDVVRLMSSDREAARSGKAPAIVDWEPLEAVGSAVCPLPGALPHVIWHEGRSVGDHHASVHHAVRAVAGDVWHLLDHAFYSADLLRFREGVDDAHERAGDAGAERLETARQIIESVAAGAETLLVQPRASYWPANYWPAWRGIRNLLSAEMARVPVLASGSLPIAADDLSGVVAADAIASPQAIAIGLLMEGKSVADVAKRLRIRRQDLYEKPEWAAVKHFASVRRNARTQGRRDRLLGQNPDRGEISDDA